MRLIQLVGAPRFGLVVNAHGKVCLVHDVPFEERRLWVGYHVGKRQLEIIFDVESTYPIDWVATDEMHEYLLKINKILIIRMQDKRPVEGWDNAFLRLKDGKTIN
jgi:hypothetical protein